MDLADGGMLAAALHSAAWRKSSHSNPSGDCLELASLPGRRVAVRDSRSPESGALVFTWDEWRAFVAGVRGDHFPNWRL